MTETIQARQEISAPARAFLTVGEATGLLVLVLIAGVFLGAFVLPGLAIGLTAVMALGYCAVVALTIGLVVIAVLDARRAERCGTA